MSNPAGVSADKIPRHIAVIMDGNGRWAREHGLPRIEGHRRGSESVRSCTAACMEAGVPYLTLYAFSKENWQRPPDEVKSLMNLLDRFLAERTAEIMERNSRLRAIGISTICPPMPAAVSTRPWKNRPATPRSRSPSR